MLKRIRYAIEKGQRAVAEASEAGPAKSKVCALLVLDELGPAAVAIRHRHLKATETEGQKPLLILGPDSELEHPDLSNLCEFLPNASDIFAVTGYRPDTILRYRVARLQLILEKWNVSECRWTGHSALELIEAWNADETITLNVRFVPAY